nr:helix-turn-helix domain-containing protein [Acrocarpospora macrocephala]
MTSWPENRNQKTRGRLSRRLPYSAGSISEHLSLLRAAGLVTAHRIGRSVLYARSAASESLLAGVRPALA